ncbi:Cadherin domain protein [Rubripirellula tenax]|uniref:Cadherin domain protein n=2 Tax=Rubripirellula tenax TaxID=2528015 RepID=A0A5C6FAF2_9BACT|nr:Cadherin domain protein [Rubripirellula tenax]
MTIDRWITQARRLIGSGDAGRNARPSTNLGRLEPRILFSATPIDVASMGIGADTAMVMELQPQSIDAEVSQSQSTTIDQLASPQTAKPYELIFVDSSVTDLNQVLDDFAASDRNFEVFVLGADRDGIDQITEILDSRSEVAAVHLFSHAENGNVRLGSANLGATNLSGYASQIASWQSSLNTGADILIYGCDLAATDNGRYLIEAIGSLTEADVAASDDDTGHSSFGGNWNLEFTTGSIETEIATSAQLQQEWLGKLSTITVTTYNDIINAGDGLTSLREAIIAASSGDTIILGTGTYTVSILGTGENNSLTGDFDINKSLTISGNGAGNTIIDGGALDRVFHIDNASAIVAFSDVTIQNGFTTGNGGGVYIEGGTATLDRVVIQGNRGAFGAGIYVNSSATLNLTDVIIQNNGDGGTTRGGGIESAGTANLLRVTFSGNQAGSGGGIYTTGTLDLTNATLSNNSASSSGGGVYSTGTTTITNSTLAFNNAGNAGGIRRQAGSVSIVNTIISDNTVTSANADVQGSFSSLGNNLILDVTGGSGFGGTDVVGSSANLGLLADNGGFGKTHAITTSSLAYNAGTATGAPATDQRGVERTSLVDIGAFERREMSATSEFRVNTTTGSVQETSGQDRGSQQSVAVADDGSYVVVWSSLNQDGDGWGVFAKRFDSSGTALTGDITVADLPANNQKWARVGTADDGSFVVTWTLTNALDVPQDVYARRFDANGDAIGTNFVVNTTTGGIQSNSSIAVNGSGTFIVAWEGNGVGDNDGIFYRRFNANGTAIDGTEVRANFDNIGDENEASVAINDSGQFAITWESAGEIYLRQFTAGGTPIPPTSDILVDSTAAAAMGSTVEIDSLGRTVVLYRTNGFAGLGAGVWGRAFHADGTERLGLFQVSNQSFSSDNTQPSIAMADNGDFIVVYHGDDNGDGNGSSVKFRRYDADTGAIATASQVNISTTGDQQFSSVAMLDMDNFVVTWSGNGTQSGNTDTSGVFARQFHLEAPTLDLDSNNSSGATGINFSRTFFNGGGAVSVADTDATIIDSDSTHLQSLTIRITDRQNGASEVLAAITSGTSITANYTAGTLTLSGSDTTANYQQVLRTVTYNNSNNPATGTSRTITFVASDGVSVSEIATTTLAISMPVNQAPTDIAISNSTVNENTNTASGFSVGVLSATDADSSTPFTWAVVGGADQARFSIGGASNNQLMLTDGVLDYEAKASYEVDVRVTDSSGNPFVETLTISVIDINEAPTVSLSVATTLLAEDTDTTSAIVVSSITVTDDALGTNTLTLSGDDASLFEIVGYELRLVAGTWLDFETNSALDVTVNVNDSTIGGTPDDTASHTITISDVNEAPSVALTPVVVTLSEDTDTTSAIVVATIVVSDDALGSATLSLAGLDAAFFEIVGSDLRLRAGASLDYETNPTLNVTVQVDDATIAGFPDDSASHSVTTTDVVEIPTTTLNPSDDTYLDKDNPDFNYGVSTTLIVDHSGGSIGDSRILLKFDFSSIPVGATITGATLTMQANAGAGTFRIGVYEVTEAWVEGNQNGSVGFPSWDDRTSTNAWNGGTFNSTAVATFDATTTGQHAWNVTSLVQSWITGSTVNNGVIIGSEAGGGNSYTYSSRDGGSPPELQLFYTVTNAAPTDIAPNTLSVAENTDSTLGVNLGTLTATDSDAGETFTWAIVGGTDETKFTINASNELILSDGMLDFERQGSYSVVVRVIDSANNIYDETLTVSITDQNEAPSVSLTPVITNIDEDSDTTSAIVVATISVTDDALGTETLSLSGDDAAMFEIAGNQLRLIAGASLDFETNASLDVSVNIDDATIPGNPDNSALHSMTVGDTIETDPVVATSDTYTFDEDTTFDSSTQWFDANWSNRRTLSFDNLNQASNLTDMPVLIRIDATRIDYSKTQNAGQDLRFVDGDGVLLAHQIESWNEAGSSYVWVKVPTVNQSSNTDFVWMYYGNAGAADGQNTATVWSDGYTGVYHFDSTTNDATAVGRHGVDSGTTNATGIVGGSRSFDGVNDVVNLGSSAAFDNLFAGGATVSAWINPSGWGENGYGRIFDKSNTVSPTTSGWDLSLDSANQSLIFEHGFSGGIGRWRVTPNSIQLNQWQSVSVTFDSSSSANNPIIYINGIQQTVTENVAPVGTSGNDAAFNLLVGNQAANNRTFEGRIDEVRIQDGIQSPDRIAADHRSTNSAFVRFGYEQDAAGVLGNDIADSDNTLVATLVSGPSFASSFSLNADGTFTYTPIVNFVGGDSFTYSTTDGFSTSNTVTVSLNVTAINDTPVITGIADRTTQDKVTVQPFSTVTFSELDGEDVTVTITVAGGDIYGQFTSTSLASSGFTKIAAGQYRLLSTTETAATAAIRQLAFVPIENQSAPGSSTVATMTVTSDDSVSPTSQSMNLSIVSVNDAPTSVTLDDVFVDEESNGAIVGNLLATDPDLGDNHTYSVDDARFTVVSGVLRLKPTFALDFETEPSIDVIVTATDDGGQTTQSSFTVQVVDQVEPPAASTTNPPTPPVTVIIPSFQPSTDDPTTSTATEKDSDRDEDSSSESSKADTAKTPNVVGGVNPANQQSDDDDAGDDVLSSFVAPTNVLEAEFESRDADEAVALLANEADGSSDGNDASSRSVTNENTNQGNRGSALNVASSFTAAQLNYMVMTKPGAMWDQLDEQRGKIESQIQGDLIVVGATGAAASSVTVGIVAWAIRSGVLASGLLAQMPAWRAVDPLLIMQGGGENSDDESLEELMSRRSEALDQQDVDSAEPT